MKRKVFAIAVLSFGHFLICIALSFLVFVSRLGSFIGAALDSSDRIVAWSLIILLFPVRDLTNLFVSYPDQWMRNPTGLLVIAGASVLWGIAIYYSVSWWRASVVKQHRL